MAAGLCEFGRGVRFGHPRLRSAAYAVGSQEDRRRAHAAIAEVMNGESDLDRRAWHRALAAVGPNDGLADELERSAARARARGGQLAVAAFLERSLDLTIDPARRATRAIAAAEARFLAGSRDDALRLISLAEAERLDEVHLARIDVLRGQLASSQRRVLDALQLLLRAAQRIERFNLGLARNAYREAFIAASEVGRFGGEAGLHRDRSGHRIGAAAGWTARHDSHVYSTPQRGSLRETGRRVHPLFGARLLRSGEWMHRATGDPLAVLRWSAVGMGLG